MTGVSHLLGSSERLAVPTNEPFTPVPTVGLPRAINGGHATAHAPEHALLVPESASNGYGVRPWELTRIEPSPVLARSTVADVAFAVLGDVAAVAALPQPLRPQAASARSITGMTAARWLSLLTAMRKNDSPRHLPRSAGLDDYVIPPSVSIARAGSTLVAKMEGLASALVSLGLDARRCVVAVCHEGLGIRA